MKSFAAQNILNYLESNSMSKRQFCFLCDISRQTLYSYLAGKPIPRKMAEKIANKTFQYSTKGKGQGFLVISLLLA